MVRDYYELEIWKRAHELTIELYKLTANPEFMMHEKFGLVQQIRRASASVGANIAEGCGRRTKKD